MSVWRNPHFHPNQKLQIPPHTQGLEPASSPPSRQEPRAQNLRLPEQCSSDRGLECPSLSTTLSSGFPVPSLLCPASRSSEIQPAHKPDGKINWALLGLLSRLPSITAVKRDLCRVLAPDANGEEGRRSRKVRCWPQRGGSWGTRARALFLPPSSRLYLSQVFLERERSWTDLTATGPSWSCGLAPAGSFGLRRGCSRGPPPPPSRRAGRAGVSRRPAGEVA